MSEKTDDTKYQNFANKSWQTRFDKMGDDSEAAFERNSGEWIRYGLNRPPFPVSRLPLGVRYTPDYIWAGNYFVEVQGCSPRKGVKLKCEKYVTIETVWHPLLPVLYFFWDSTRELHTVATQEKLRQLIKSDQATIGTFKDPGGEKPFWQLKTNMFDWIPDGDAARISD